MTEGNKVIELKFSDLVDKFREKFRDSKPIIEGRDRFDKNFRKPCQFTILWIKFRNEQDFQLILKSNNPKIPDKKLKFYGPFSLESEKQTKDIEEVLKRVFFEFVEKK